MDVKSKLLFGLCGLSALALAGCATSPPDLAPHSGFVDVPGGPVWYQVMGTGEGDGIPLVYMHGGPGGTSCWHQLLARLGDERPVIRYDQLGTGRSGRPDDLSLWNRDRFVEEFDAIRDALGLDEIHLGGHSWGGSLAAYYFLETGGEGVHSLVLSSPLISTEAWIEDTNYLRTLLPEDVQAVLTEHEAAGTTDSAEYAEATAVFYAAYMSPGEVVESYSCPGAPGNSFLYNYMWGPTEFNATGTLKDFDVTDRLADIDVPVLFMTGEFDEARPVTVEGFAERVPDARFEMLPGVGHAGPSRVPDLYRQLIRDFITEVEAEEDAQR